MALIEMDDCPSERNLHFFLGFSMAMLNNQMVNLPKTGYNPQAVYSNPFQQSGLLSDVEARMKVGMQRVAESPSGEDLPHEVVMPRARRIFVVAMAGMGDLTQKKLRGTWLDCDFHLSLGWCFLKSTGNPLVFPDQVVGVFDVDFRS